MRISQPPAMGLVEFRLRPIEADDMSAWYEYLRLPHVVKHTSWNVASTEDLKPLIETYNSTDESSAIRFVIQEAASNRLVGTIGFHTISIENKTAEIAYDLHPDWWRRGIATAACKAVSRWGLNVYGFVRVQATTLETNENSKQVLQRCGFEFEGKLHCYRMVRGVPRDFLLYSVVSNVGRPTHVRTEKTSL
jgi:[ribosomal protein S5]-alanine N-acetyltransferase